ncbi:MAG TPA: hypothetical protein VK718_04985 [Ferruginibacter sp.]|jgi:hypothetical protein|nr:hypothetical protein [Ferruginibacter sp.]
MQKEVIDNIKKDMAIALPDEISLLELEEKLTVYANLLIQKDFQKLVTLLYRIDVSEAKLKYLLQLRADENAGNIIAKLIIERQIQKMKSRQQFGKSNTDIPEEEKW